MTHRSFEVDGVLFLRLEVVAEIYSVESSWLDRAIEAGLVGPIVRHEGFRAIPVPSLDRVAAIVRLHRGLGLDLDAITLFFDRDDAP